MSAKRLNKRQLRQQQELQDLALSNAPAALHTHAETAQDHDDQQPDITSTPATKSKKNKKQRPLAQPASIFAALRGTEDADEEEEEEPEEEQDGDDGDGQRPPNVQPTKSSKKKTKKKKKKLIVATAAEGEGQEQSGEVASTSKAASSKKSKASAKGTGASAAASKSKDVDDMSMEELNALLESQACLAASSSADGKSGTSAPARPPPASSFRTHLSLDPRSLDPSIELRRQFGSAAIKAYENEVGGGGRGASVGARARAHATNSNLKLRSLLCQPAEYWPPIGRTFTGMDMDVRDTPSGRVCAWRHSKAYKQVQMQFLQAVQSHDPNSLMALLRVYPWHIDTLLQLSDYSRHQGDVGQAADFNARALFAFERTASPYFASCLSSSTSGPPLVDFLKIENRAFYLAVHRNLGFLGRRGTWQTALEWSKILLGLGKDGEDHHAALLWIDFLANKARQGRWLLELWGKLDMQRGKQRGSFKRIEELSVPAETCIDHEKKDAGEDGSYEGTLDWCVGLQYARALAFKAIEKEEKDKSGVRSRAALRLAIARHPMAVPVLASKVGIDLPDKIATHPLFQLVPRYDEANDSLPHLLSQIYGLRSESLWKEPGCPEWLRETTVELFDTLVKDYEATGGKRKRREAVADQKTRQGIYRHVLVSDLPDNVRQQLIGYLPPEVTHNSEMMDAFDPIPPISRELYGQRGAERSGGGGSDKEEEVTRYDDAYFAPIMGVARGGEDGSARQADGEGAQGLMQAFMRALQGVRGMRGWNEAMENMDDETREDVMAQILEMTAQARQQRGADLDEPPGGFGALDGAGTEAGAGAGAEDEDEEGNGGGGRIGGGAFAALRNALNAVWGVGGTAHQVDGGANDDGFETEEDDETEHA
ncbi:hypothetical protein ACQY0O_005280 [Thecaphora frezii]